MQHSHLAGHACVKVKLHAGAVLQPAAQTGKDGLPVLGIVAALEFEPAMGKCLRSVTDPPANQQQDLMQATSTAWTC